MLDGDMETCFLILLNIFGGIDCTIRIFQSPWKYHGFRGEANMPGTIGCSKELRIMLEYLSYVTLQKANFY